MSLCTVFDSISSNIDEVLSINPSANVLFFGDLDVVHKGCLTYSGGTAGPGDLVTQRCCLLHLIKQNCLVKIFLRTLILMTQVSFYHFPFYN